MPGRAGFPAHAQERWYPDAVTCSVSTLPVRTKPGPGDGDGDGAPDPIACSDEPLELQAAATRATPASIVAARAVDQRLGITVVVLLPLGHGGRGCHH